MDVSVVVFVAEDGCPCALWTSDEERRRFS